MTQHRRTFVRTMSALPVALAALAVLAFGAYFGGQAIGVAAVGSPYVAGDPMDVRPAVDDSAAALMADAGCWSGEAPANMAGKLPGHVVVSVDGVAQLGGERMVGKALAQLFDGAEHGLTIHGFCR